MVTHSTPADGDKVVRPERREEALVLSTLQDVLTRLRAEYLEMPGMRLRPEQVRRLCGIDPTVCQTVLDALVETKFLCVTADRLYARSTDGELRRPRSTTADPGTGQVREPVRRAVGAVA